MRNLVLLEQVSLNGLHLSLRLFDVGSLGEPKIHAELESRRLREETLLDELKAPDCKAEDSRHGSKGQPSQADAAPEEGFEGEIEPAPVGIAVITTRRLRLEKHHA